jgi:hypothetical protein
VSPLHQPRQLCRHTDHLPLLRPEETAGSTYPGLAGALVISENTTRFAGLASASTWRHRGGAPVAVAVQDQLAIPPHTHRLSSVAAVCQERAAAISDPASPNTATSADSEHPRPGLSSHQAGIVSERSLNNCILGTMSALLQTARALPVAFWLNAPSTLVLQGCRYHDFQRASRQGWQVPTSCSVVACRNSSCGACRPRNTC